MLMKGKIYLLNPKTPTKSHKQKGSDFKKINKKLSAIICTTSEANKNIMNINIINPQQQLTK